MTPLAATISNLFFLALGGLLGYALRGILAKRGRK